MGSLWLMAVLFICFTKRPLGNITDCKMSVDSEGNLLTPTKRSISMDSETRNKTIQNMMDKDMELMAKKGHDYSGDEDCLQNLRDFGFYGVVVRLSDKFSRLRQFAKSGTLSVSGECILDTLKDIRIYAYLAEILYNEEM